MLLIVDENEFTTAPRVTDNLQMYFKDCVIKANLQAGDINIPLDDGSVLAIERKEANDFLGSIADGRIFSQVERMHKFSKYVAIVITGNITYDKNDVVYVDKRETGWNGKSVRSVMRVVQMSGCVLEYCPVDKFCSIIEEIYATANKPSERQGLHRKRIVTFPPVDPRVEAIALFPGIGLKRAESLMSSDIVKGGMSDDEYGQLGKALEVATTMPLIDKELRPVGWGAKTILNLRKFLGLQGNEYIKVEVTNEHVKTDEASREDIAE